MKNGSVKCKQTEENRKIFQRFADFLKSFSDSCKILQKNADNFFSVNVFTKSNNVPLRSVHRSIPRQS